MKNLIILALGAALVWVTTALARVENERYALSLGMCFQKNATVPISDPACLANVRTRTDWWWHATYALGIM